MTDIRIYDDTANKIENLAEEYDTSVAEIIDALMDFIDEVI